MDEQKQLEEITKIVDKTITNHKIMLDAMALSKKPESFQSDLDKQKIHAAMSLHRCRRCGDPLVPLLPSAELSMVCGDCESFLRELDKPLWFVQMLEIIAKGDKSHG